MQKRLDYCKEELNKNKENIKKLEITYQELNNMLPTYKEKKALQALFSELRGNRVF